MAVSGPHRRPHGPHPPRRERAGAGRRPPSCPEPGATRPGSPGWAATGTRPAPTRPPRSRRPAARAETSAPCSSSSVSAPIAKMTVSRTTSGHTSRPAGSQPATRTRDPATTAQTCTLAAVVPLPGSPAGRRARARPRRRPPGGARQEQGGELAAPPGLGGGDPQPRAAGRDRLPGQGQHVHVLISHAIVRYPHAGEPPEPEGTAVMINLLLSYGQSAGPVPGAGRDDRRSSPGRASSQRRPPRPGPPGRPAAAARTWRRAGAADLTRRAESSVDAAGPGRKASRTGRPARNTAFVARCGRSAPPAAARDPRRPRPAAGGRGEERRPW